MLLGNLFGPDLGIVVVVILVVLVGGSQLPKIARNVGSAGREFRKAQEEAEAEDARKAASTAAAPAPIAAAPVPAPPAPPAAAPVPAQTPAAAAAPTDDKVTISKSELEALLDERLKGGSATN